MGEDVETIILRLLQNADYDVKRAELGIVYIDEIDKIGRKSDSASITRDVSGEGFSKVFLRFLRARFVTSHRKADASILKLNIFRSTPRIFCLFAVVALSVLRRSFIKGWEAVR